jgi:hypothetical protein
VTALATAEALSRDPLEPVAGKAERRGPEPGVAHSLGRGTPVAVEPPADIRIGAGELLIGDGQ